MQSAKLQIGKTYAVRYEDMLHAFTVTSSVTSRTAQKSVTVANGYFDADAVPRPQRQFDVADLIGPFEEHAALVAKKKAEDDARKAADAAREKLRDDVVEALAGILKLEKNAPGKSWRLSKEPYEHLRAGYSGVEIKDAVLTDLLAFLTKA